MKSITDDLSESNIEKIFNGIDSSGDMRIDFMEFKVDILLENIFYQSDGQPAGDDEEDN